MIAIIDSSLCKVSDAEQLEVQGHGMSVVSAFLASAFEFVVVYDL